MKKLIVSFAFVLIALTSYAQGGSEHLTFKGIPIEGSMTEFCQKLKAKGFTSIGSENNLALFMGDFTGRNATIGVTATDDGKSVFAVAVLFDPSGEWNTLVNTYNYYKREIIPEYFHGTGDCFASALTAAITKGKSIEEANKIAVDFTVNSILETIKYPNIDKKYGVNFEEALESLICEMKK